MKKKLLFLLLPLLFVGCDFVKNPSSSFVSSSETVISSSSSISVDSSIVSSSNSKSSLSFSSSSNDESSITFSSGPLSISSVVSGTSEKLFPDVTYANQINKPSSVVHNIEDLVAISDYYAFYYIPSFKVTMANDYTYVSSDKNIKVEMNYLYWCNDLVNGVMGMSGNIAGNELTINYTFYDYNTLSCEPRYVNAKDLSYAYNHKDNNITFETDTKDAPVADVYDSQQLFYAAENGYKINIIEDSPAERVYAKAKETLGDIIDNSMSAFEKTCAIYDYIEHNTVYDYEVLETPEVEDPVNFPDAECAKYRSFYVEGCLFDHLCVCDSYAKTMSLLCNMAGVDAFRGSGTSDREFQSREVYGHAYTFVNIDDVYYLCCPTWGQIKGGRYVLTYSKYFLTAHEMIEPYDSVCLHRNVEVANSFVDYQNKIIELEQRRFNALKVTYNETTVSCYIKSLDDLKVIESAVENTEGSYVTIYVDDESVINQISSYLSTDCYASNHIYTTLIGPRTMSLRAYEIIIYHI